MKRVFLSILVCLFLFSANVFSEGVTIYGFRVYQGAKPSTYTAGPVKFNTSNTADVQLIADQTSLGRINAGEYYNYKWYAMTTAVGTQSTPDSWVEVDMKTGERKFLAKATTQLRELTYDYTSINTMYGLYGDEYLVKVDMTNWSITTIGKFPTEVYCVGLACALNGDLYVLSIDDNLYKVSKTDASALTLVGKTGINVAMYQTMAFDHNTGILYSVNTDGYIYTLDTTTGKATELGPMGDAEDQLTSLFIPYTKVAAGTPERIENLNVQTTSTGYTFAWKYPTTDVQGKPLTTAIGAKIYQDNVEVASIPSNLNNVGQTGTISNTVTPGKYTYRIVCYNEKGEGGYENFTVSVGVPDAPGEVKNFNVVSGDNTAELSWTAPDHGATYGANFAPTSYIITRVGGNSVTVDGSKLSYSMSVTSWGRYSFSITPVNAAGNGPTTYSSTVLIKPANWNIMTDGTFETGTGKFYDEGGPSGNYKNSSRITMTLKPQAGKGLKFSFTQFATEKAYGSITDYLEAYAGSTKDAPLIGKFGGEVVPDELKALYTNGAITFYFYSDVMTNYVGWAADITSYDIKKWDIAAQKVTYIGYPSVGVSSDFPVTVQNVGSDLVTAGAYQVKLVDANNNVLAYANGVDIQPMETKTITVQYAPLQKGNLVVKAIVDFSGDGELTNNTTDPVTVNILEEGTFMASTGEINADNQLGISPMSFFSEISYSQILIPSSLLNKKDVYLTKLVYPCTITTAYSAVPVKIWVSETDKEDLSGGSVLASEMQLVFDGTINVVKNATQLEIPLTTPYKYNGKNLLVSVYKSGTGTDDMGVLFYYIPMDKSYTLADPGWGEEDPNPNAAFPEYSDRQDLPAMNLFFNKNISNGVDDISIDNVQLYPNPFTDYIIVKTDKVLQLKIYNVAGQCFVNTTVSAGSNKIDVRSLPKGIYLVQCGNNVSKVIK
ncbi:MAG: T9SS type A sorting domain-containing protein [Paludibacteraceae bacterium]